MNLITKGDSKENDFINKRIRTGGIVKSSLRIKKIFRKSLIIRRRSVKDKINCKSKFCITEL